MVVICPTGCHTPCGTAGVLVVAATVCVGVVVLPAGGWARMTSATTTVMTTMQKMTPATTAFFPGRVIPGSFFLLGDWPSILQFRCGNSSLLSVGDDVTESGRKGPCPQYPNLTIVLFLQSVLAL